MRNYYRQQFQINAGTKLLKLPFEEAVLENPHETIVPKGLRHEVGNATRPQSVQRNGIMAYPDCMQSGDACKGNTDIPKEATFRTGMALKLGNGFLQNRPDREE